MEKSKWDDGTELTNNQQGEYRDIAKVLYERLIVYVWTGPRQEQIARAAKVANAVTKAADLIAKELY
jgi:hypothetical protein